MREQNFEFIQTNSCTLSISADRDAGPVEKGVSDYYTDYFFDSHGKFFLSIVSQL